MMRPSPRWHASISRSIRIGRPAMLLLAVLLAVDAGCASGEKGARPPAPKPAGEVFESFDAGAVIEEETIAPPLEPAPPLSPPPLSGGYQAPGTAPGLSSPVAPPPEDRDRARGRSPLSSPGAAPAGAAPPQPGDLQ